MQEVFLYLGIPVAVYVARDVVGFVLQFCGLLN